jgi:hypothetical protein
VTSRQKLSKFQNQLLIKYPDFDAMPEKALATVNCAYQWEVDQHFAITTLHENLVEDVAIALFSVFVRRWQQYYLAKPMVIESSKEKIKWENKNPNRWLRKRIKMVQKSAKLFPVSTARLKSDGVRTMEAQVWSLKCAEIGRECANDGLTVVDIVQQVQLLADQWGFKPLPPTQVNELFEDESTADYLFRIKEDEAWFHLERLLDESWWKRKIEVAYRQFCEHCQIIAGRVHKGASQYLSMAGRANYKARKDAGVLALAKLVALNTDTGEELPMLDVVKNSTANPAIRRCELMVRCSGFELLAQEFGLMGGFFTFTAPSRFHAYNSSKDQKWAYDNNKYCGVNPMQTQKYLSKVWARARAKLKRMDIQIFGFRVCEPHHDGTPHWHALFFFKPEDEQAIRFVFADYFTQENRDELHVGRQDFKAWGKSIKAGFSTKDMFVPEKIPERKHIFSVSKRIKRRFDYKRIDPKKGSATGYIAKYISKNIDGYKMPDDEDTGTPADETALAVCGWASTWCIRQFQQIGGAPVSVWRELRRLDQTESEVAEMKARKEAQEKGEKYVSSKKIQSFYDLQKQHDSIEVARISANSGNWSMYIHAMGGIFCPRKNHPIKMTYKDSSSKYGEVAKKVKGITNDLKTMITHSDGWVITSNLAEEVGGKTGAQLPWSSVTNCTVSINEDEKQEVSNLLRERGEKVTDRILTELLSFTDVIIEERWVGDVKRVTWGRLKQNVMNIGGNFRLRVWEEKIKRNVKYVDPLPNRFKHDPTGKRNAFFDTTPISEDEKRKRKEHNNAWYQEQFPLTWEEFEDNVAENGEYQAPERKSVPYDYVYSLLKKGGVIAKSFAGYMDTRRSFNPDEGIEGVKSFADFVKELVPLTDEYKQAIQKWVNGDDE